MSYATTILADSPSYYWKLNDPSGGAVDSAAGGANTGTYQGTVTRGQTGPPSTGDNATLFDGSTGWVSTTTSLVNPTNPFTLEGWFNTTSVAGGAIFAFTNSQTGVPGSEDRTLYVGTDGKVYFGIFTTATVIINSTLAYNDGNWHYAAGVIAANGNMSLFVDGGLVAGPSANVTAPVSYTGFWRIGLMTSGTSWTNLGSNSHFAGTLAEAAIYPAALTSGQVSAHYVAGAGGATTGIPIARSLLLPRSLGPRAVGPTFFAAFRAPPPAFTYPPAATAAPGPGMPAAGALGAFMLGAGAAPIAPISTPVAPFLPRTLGPVAVGPTFFAALRVPPASQPATASPQDLGTPTAQAATAAIALVTAATFPTPPDPTATATTAATALVTAPTFFTAAAAAITAATAAATAASKLSPTAQAATSATAVITAISLLAPTAQAATAATAAATAASLLAPSAQAATAATCSVTAGVADLGSPTAQAATAATAPLTARSLLAPTAQGVTSATADVTIPGSGPPPQRPLTGVGL